MNNLKVMENEATMTSLELAKVFGIQHTRVMVRLGKLADKDECTYAPISYTDSMNRQQTMFEINMAKERVEMFAELIGKSEVISKQLAIDETL